MVERTRSGYYNVAVISDCEEKEGSLAQYLRNSKSSRENQERIGRSESSWKNASTPWFSESDPTYVSATSVEALTGAHSGMRSEGSAGWR